MISGRRHRDLPYRAQHLFGHRFRRNTENFSCPPWNQVHALIQTPEPNLTGGMQSGSLGMRTGTPNATSELDISTKDGTKPFSSKMPDTTGRLAAAFT